MRRPILPMLCLALAALSAPLPAAGQDSADSPGSVRQLYLAQQVYDLGLAGEDAVMLLAAVRLARGASLRAATGWERTGPAIVVDSALAAPDTGLPRDPASGAALALALLMAEGDPALADLAADIEADLNRGILGEGQVSSATSRLGSGETDEWRIAFNGQLPAEIAMIGDGSGNLDMTVSDEAGEVICRENGPSDRAYCGFVPLQNGFFIVTITNPGPDDSRYRLLTN